MTLSDVSATGAAKAAPDSPTPRSVPFRRRSKRMRKALPYLLVAPAVLYLLVITLYPGVFAIVQSFHNVKFGPWQPAGFANYAKLWGDYQFWGAL